MTWSLLDYNFSSINPSDASDGSDASSDSGDINNLDIMICKKNVTCVNLMKFPIDIIILILSILSIHDLVTLDIAYCNRMNQQKLGDFLFSNPVFYFDSIRCEYNWNHVDSALTWAGLRQLNISSLLVLSRDHLTSKGLMGLARHCPGLTTLDISKCKNVTDIGIVHIARNCPGLTSLDISKCKNVTGDSILEIARNCPGLLFLSACYCNIGDAAVAEIARRCRSLDSLLLEGCYFSDTGLLEVARHSSKLKCLNIARCGFSYDIITPLATLCTSLETLYINSREEEIQVYDVINNNIKSIRQRHLAIELCIHDYQMMYPSGSDSDSDSDSDSNF